MVAWFARNERREVAVLDETVIEVLDDTQTSEAELTAERGRRTRDVCRFQRAEGHRHVGRHRRAEQRAAVGVDARRQINGEYQGLVGDAWGPVGSRAPEPEGRVNHQREST